MTLAMARKKKKEVGVKNPNPFTRMFRVFSNNISLHEVAVDTIGSYAAKYDGNTIEKAIARIKAYKVAGGKRKQVQLSKEEVSRFREMFERRPSQHQLFG